MFMETNIITSQFGKRRRKWDVATRLYCEGFHETKRFKRQNVDLPPTFWNAELKKAVLPTVASLAVLAVLLQAELKNDPM